MIEVNVHLVLERWVKGEDAALYAAPPRKIESIGCYTKKVLLPYPPSIGMDLSLKDLSEYYGNHRYFKITSIMLFDDRDLASVYIQKTFKEEDFSFKNLLPFLLSKGWFVCSSPDTP